MTLIRFWRRCEPVWVGRSKLEWEYEDVPCLVWDPTQPIPEGWR